MIIATITVSIFAIAGAAWLANKILPFGICPVCAGVAGTWLWMLAGIFTNNLQPAIYTLPIAILMGGSVVGIAYQIAKMLSARKSEVLFKMLFIPAGFIAVYSFLSYLWFVLVPALVFLAIVAWAFLRGVGDDKTIKGKMVGELEKKMEDCC